MLYANLRLASPPSQLPGLLPLVAVCFYISDFMRSFAPLTPGVLRRAHHLGRIKWRYAKQPLDARTPSERVGRSVMAAAQRTLAERTNAAMSPGLRGIVSF